MPAKSIGGKKAKKQVFLWTIIRSSGRRSAS